METTDSRIMELLKTYRRDLHKIPEIGSALYKTNEYIRKVLDPLRCTVEPAAETGLCAFFDMGRECTTAIRCDMDALPVLEANTCDYASVHEGKMHACGHDGHMSMLLALAGYLDMVRDLPSNALLIFQPAEETTGGAKDICNTGIFERHNVTRIFGIHLWPFLPAGQLSARPGPQMAKSSEITFEITGRSSHAAAAEKGIDALYIACEYILSAYKMQCEEIPAEQRTLLKICKMESGSARNVIAGRAALLGTMRAFDMDTFAYMRRRLTEIGTACEQQYGCKVSFHCSEGYPPVINDSALFETVRPCLAALDFEELPDAVMISEDFSFYGLRVPSVFFFLGTGTGIALHSNHFDFDESILLSGYQLYKTLLNA